MSTRRMRLLSLALAALIVPAARADVIVVDPAGGSGVEALRSALGAAAPGDVLLLQPGEYLSSAPPYAYAIGQGLTLLPAPGAGRITLGPIDIAGLPAGQTVVLRGFDIRSAVVLYQPLLYLHGSNGALWVEDCDISAIDGNPLGGSSVGFFVAAVEINGAHAQGVFRQCTLNGGRGIDSAHSPAGFTGSGGDALRLVDGARAMLHDCTLRGGDAGAGKAKFLGGDYGGYGLYLFASDVTLAGCSLQGGAEGALNDDLPGTAGMALFAWLAASDARVLDCTFAAGAVQGEGMAVPAIYDPHDGVYKLDEPARTLVLPDQLREGESGLLALDGQPGDVAFVLASPFADLLPLKGQEGTLVTQLGAMQGPFVLATLPGPDGHLEIPFTMPQLPAGIEAASVIVQGLFKDADGSSLGGASALTWIDQAF